MQLRLDRSSPTTLVGQLVDGITRLVADGALAGGDRLPPSRALARDLGTTRGTVVSAYEILLENGTLEAHVGRGTFVAARAVARARATARSAGEARTASAAGSVAHVPAHPAPHVTTHVTTHDATHDGPNGVHPAPLPLVPEDDAAHANQPAARNGGSKSNGAAAAAAARTFWDSLLGGPAHHDSHDGWLGRGSADAISFAYSVPPAELFPLTDFRRASDKALLVRGRDLLQLGPADGFPPLKREIASRMTREGAPTDPDDVVITTGCQQALDLACRVLVRPGDVVVLEEPTYPGAIQLLRGAGATLLPWHVSPEGWNVDELAATLRDRRVRLIYVAPDFHNPTGRTMDLATRRRLIALAARHGVPILEDGITAALRYRGAPQPSLRALDRHGAVVYMSSFSKITFPGVRLGWIVAAHAAREHLVEAKQASDLQTSGPTQAAMYEFARSGALDRHLDRTRREYARRRDALHDALTRHLPAGCAWTVPDGGLSLWLTLPADVDADRIAARALDAKVAVSPGRFFHAGRPREQAIRLAFALNPIDVAEEGVRRLGRVLRAAIEERGDPGRRGRVRSRTALV